MVDAVQAEHRVRPAALFRGRASRPEFLESIFLGAAALSGAAIIDLVAFPGLHLAFCGPATAWAMLALMLPFLSLSVRRLHDIGRRGNWLLLVLVPVFGILILMLWFLSDGQARRNRYGRDPLNP